MLEMPKSTPMEILNYLFLRFCASSADRDEWKILKPTFKNVPNNLLRHNIGKKKLDQFSSKL